MWKGSRTYFNPDAWTVLHRISRQGGFSLRFVSDGATTIPYAWFVERRGRRAHAVIQETAGYLHFR